MTGRFTCNQEIRLLLSMLTLVKLLMLFHTKNCSLDYNRTKLDVLSCCGYSIFFCGRTHQTKIGDSLSDMLFLLSGVIQGSAIIMVNDTHTRRRLKMATFDRPYTAFY